MPTAASRWSKAMRSRSSATCPTTACSRTSRTTARSRRSRSTSSPRRSPNLTRTSGPGSSSARTTRPGASPTGPTASRAAARWRLPAPPEDRVQFIDVRDLANWMVGLCERGDGGELNAVNEGVSWSDLLETCRDVSSSDASFVWIDGQFLLEQGIEQWMGLPLWIEDEADKGLHRADFSRAARDGPHAPAARGDRQSDTRARRDDRGRRPLPRARGGAPRSVGRPVASRRWRGSTSCTANRSAFGTSTRWGT